jgi:RecB family exonuclease
MDGPDPHDGYTAEQSTDDHAAGDPNDDALTPVQQQILSELGATTAERPEFDPTLARRMRSYLDDSVRTVLDGLAATGDGSDGHAAPQPEADGRSERRLPLYVSKHALMQVHNCEGLYLADEAVPFEWTVRTATGTIVHKAIELGVSWDPDPVPAELVDAAISSLTESTASIGDWLYGLDERQRAELRGAAVEMSSAFWEVFPPLKPRWRPVAENRLRAELGGSKGVVVSGRVDLTLGRAEGNRAGKVIIDFKTGAMRQHHTDDLRFYALLETLARGTPPRLLATLYLDAGQLRTEAVTEDLLTAALRRTMDGAARIAAVTIGRQDPELTPGYHCRWCPAAATCDTGQAWLAAVDDTDRYDPDDI